MKRFQDLTVFGLPATDPEELSPTARVKAAIEAASGKRTRIGGFVFDRVSRREAFLAPLLGAYLGFAVARVHERFPVLAVPMLLSGLMAIMLITLFFSLPPNGWRSVWEASPQLRLVAVLAGAAVATIPLGIWMSGALDFLLNRYIIALSVYVACLFLLRDRRSLRRAVALYVLLAVFVTGQNLADYYGGRGKAAADAAAAAAEQPEDQPINPDAGITRQSFGSLDPNDIAAVMATTFPLALWLAAGTFRRKLLWMPCALLFAIGVIPTASRGGLIGLVAAAVVLCLVGAKGWRRIFLIAALVAAAFAFMALAGGQMDRMDDLGGDDYNYTASEGRIAIWRRGIVWTIKRPWGYGLNNFPTYFAWLNGPDRAAHSSLIQYSVELGVVGIAAYLLICGTLVKSLLRIRGNAMRANPPDNDTVALTGHLLGMLAGCWVTGLFLSNAYYPMTYMAIGISSAVVLSTRGGSEPEPAAPAHVPVKTRARRRRQLRAFDTA